MIGANRVTATSRAEYPEPDDVRGSLAWPKHVPAARVRQGSGVLERLASVRDSHPALLLDIAAAFTWFVPQLR